MQTTPSFCLLLLLTLLSSCRTVTPTTPTVANWRPADCPIPTRWSAAVDPRQPLAEYPRPVQERAQWLNLNGLWEYDIQPRSATAFGQAEGQILVPFAVESSLSGVKKAVATEERLWYRRSLNIPKDWSDQRILLHFEAVDWETQVWIDGREVGSHRGGYDPFTFEITDYVQPGGRHSLTVAVWDPTNDGTQPRGKQVNDPGGIFYTSVTGIWQTVWLEPVPPTYIADFRATPDIDQQRLLVALQIDNPRPEDQVRLTAKAEGRTVATVTGLASEQQPLQIPGARLWSPESPFLYDLEVALLRDGRVVDRFASYFGMRKISLGKDDQGVTRILLNDRYVFQNGPLDQGFWPDGIYTAPTDEALRYDLEVTKQLGFNMLRKHVKVENRRFYSWCDRLGLLVWQDMPSGERYIGPADPDIERSEASARQFEDELERMIQTHYNHPSIIMWVPFNEGWGQYDTPRITELVKQMDPSRLVNNASGWADRGVGDVYDLHHYPHPIAVPLDDDRASVLGEFGGLGLAVRGHLWVAENWGYSQMADTAQLLNTLEDYYGDIHAFERDSGLSAVVYTQTTDVETETNGLMTYDRAVIKGGVEGIRRAMRGFAPPVLLGEERRFLNEFRIALRLGHPEAAIHYTQDGSDPTTASPRYSGPFTTSQGGTLKLRAFWPDGRKSRVRAYELIKIGYQAAVTPPAGAPKLQLKHYDGRFSDGPTLLTATPTKTTTDAIAFDLKPIGREENYGLVWEGYFHAPTKGLYTFYTNSDDGTQLWLGDELVVDNDGHHGPRVRSGICALEGGYHPFRLLFYQGGGGQHLEVWYEGPDGKKRMLESSDFR